MGILRFCIVCFVSILCSVSPDTDNKKQSDRYHARGLGDQMISWLFIIPGTKWCGVGNTSENFEDLGTEQEVDACCRTHDQCSDYIMPLQSNYGLWNLNTIYAKFNCDCDLKFHQCLSDINTAFSAFVGGIYFDTIGTECFKLQHPILTCLKYSSLPAIKCIEYEYDTTQEMQYQWQDVPNYNQPLMINENAALQIKENMIWIVIFIIATISMSY